MNRRQLMIRARNYALNGAVIVNVLMIGMFLFVVLLSIGAFGGH